MKNNEQLINNIIGQLNGIKKMIKNKEDCFKILIQLKASRSAVENLTLKYLEKNAINCVSNNENNNENREKLAKLIKEIVKTNH